MSSRHFSSLLPMCALAASLLAPLGTRAHCDGMDGPVVKAAQHALQAGDVNLVLVWVQKQDEGRIRDAFKRTLAVRKLGPEAQGVADTWFFETLVRVHRAGEGAAFTGLKPAGLDLGPAIPAADAALATGKAEPLVKLLENAMHGGLHRRLARALDAKGYGKDDVEAGRRFVASYVDYVHHVERLYEAATGHPKEHDAETERASAHHHDETPAR
jgi:hypothetical protein